MNNGNTSLLSSLVIFIRFFPKWFTVLKNLTKIAQISQLIIRVSSLTFKKKKKLFSKKKYCGINHYLKEIMVLNELYINIFFKRAIKYFVIFH